MTQGAWAWRQVCHHPLTPPPQHMCAGLGLAALPAMGAVVGLDPQTLAWGLVDAGVFGEGKALG